MSSTRRSHPPPGCLVRSRVVFRERLEAPLALDAVERLPERSWEGDEARGVRVCWHGRCWAGSESSDRGAASVTRSQTEAGGRVTSAS